MTSTAPDLLAIYTDLHQHPELSHHETRTAGIVAHALREYGYEVRDGVGGTGVVGILANGTGPTVAMRADMDALPIQEATGLPYASTNDGVMHACGHDVHVTCLLGAAAQLAADRDAWSGTAMLVFQPAEEKINGAQAMVDDPAFAALPQPSILLGQHVAPLPVGLIGLRPGPAFAATDSFKITLFGQGGHGSRPETTVDPVVLAAATVLRLQTVVSREIAGGDTAVLTVGSLHAGTAPNIIPDRAELQLNIRSYTAPVRQRILAAVERIVHAEAQASGAPRPPEIEPLDSAPPLVNDPDASDATRPALASVVGAERVVDPGPVTGSEDVGVLAAAWGVPLVFWLLGGADPQPFAGAGTVEQIATVMGDIPSNHSPYYAPVPDPTLRLGVAALVAAARHWLG